MLCQNCGDSMLEADDISPPLHWCSTCGTIKRGDGPFGVPAWSKEPPAGGLLPIIDRSHIPQKKALEVNSARQPTPRITQRIAGAYGKDLPNTVDHEMGHLVDENGDEKEVVGDPIIGKPII